MTTPIVMLLLMAGPALLARAAAAAAGRPADIRRAAAFGLGLMFVFTGLGHFVETETMALMVPAWVPARVPMIYATGVLEFAIALGFFVRPTTRLAGWAAAGLLIVFFPVNVYAAINRVPMGGHAWGPVYLLVRAPVQLAILLWTYWFTIRRE